MEDRLNHDVIEELIKIDDTQCNSGRPFISIPFGNISVNWLVDSGATRGALDRETFDKINTALANSLVIKPPHPSMAISGASGAQLSIQGTTVLPLKVNGVKFEQQFVIVGTLNSKAILGMDFLKKTNASIDCATNQVTFNGSWSKVPPRRSNSRRHIIKLARKKTIPGMSQAIVRAETTAINALGFCEAGLVPLSEAIVETDNNGRFLTVITNSAPYEMTLPKGTEIGLWESVDEAHLLNIEEIKEELEKVPTPTEVGKGIDKKKEELIKTSANLSQVPAEFKDRYMQLLLKYADVFSADPFDLGTTDVIKHKVNLKHKNPIHKKQFRLPWAHEKFVNDQTTELLKKRVIQPSTSPYNAPIFAVKKPHGNGLRLVVDFRDLNLASMEDRYVIREISECIDNIGKRKSKVFSALDLTSGF